MGTHSLLNWQRRKNIQERNEIMLEQELATDVSFVVSSTEEGLEETINAHKYMLISASSVFWFMFCGDLQERDKVKVPDVEPEAFREMLRFIYTEQCSLTHATIMHVLNASKKYDLPCLTKKCVDYMEKCLEPTNAFAILEHSLFFEECTLSNKCLELIEDYTLEAFNSSAFMDISQDTLSFVLGSDHLDIDELELFKLCCKWGESKIHQSKDNISLRDIIGKALYNIRFPVMSAVDFTNIVRPTEVLTSEEQASVYAYLAVPEERNIPPMFSTRKRKGVPAVGDKVRIKPSVSKPKHGWGVRMNHHSTGFIKSINETEVIVDFPESQNWSGVLSELELV